MKDEIKSLPEYQALVMEYNESDSVSRRESIEDAVYNTAKALLHKLIALYAKYGQSYVYDSDFRENCGELSLGEFDESTVGLHYEDHWAYGGECYIGIEVQMKYLDSDEMKVLEAELRSGQIASLKGEINRMEQEIDELSCKVADYKAKLDQLVSEILKENNNEDSGNQRVRAL